MPELGEAGARDEADPAGAEDAYLGHRPGLYFATVSGLRPLAIAIIVSFESVVEQRVDDPVARVVDAQHDHVQVRARVVELELAAA